MATGRIVLKTDRDVAGIRKAAAVVERALAAAAGLVRPGTPTQELDDAAEAVIRDAGGRPAFKGYRMGGDTPPFPGSLCISVNDVVVHGFPSSYALQEGDIVSVDCGVELDGYFGDFAYTFPVGTVSAETQELLATTRESLYLGIGQAGAGRRTGDIGHAVQDYCEGRGYGVVRDLVGHGVGRRLHEPPNVPNVGRKGVGKKLKPGMTLCIEPMINGGTSDVTVDDDGWTVRTADGRPSAHFEHMVLVQKGHAEVLSSYDLIERALAEAGAPATPPAHEAASPQ
ncbi:type I methionyl aminopeptidase [Rubrivirga sp. S365]|uniref:Methionine aminopeptidase n=1 Tax=Rubrivirga litoralis TaxID=3075598 RepID=A0ABU3BS02_9BACT|nr:MULTISPECIES: type I methionyl aminopeptidase [unclassified Rubrivirga]MDT0632070.1 type I methionyl aminopeptidase [Rubrivirga sp. F394]MDT7856148.1 type I methionyl aminopeptidase [Rubrivirga sp. S365]